MEWECQQDPTHLLAFCIGVSIVDGPLSWISYSTKLHNNFRMGRCAHVVYGLPNFNAGLGKVYHLEGQGVPTVGLNIPAYHMGLLRHIISHLRKSWVAWVCLHGTVCFSLCVSCLIINPLTHKKLDSLGCYSHGNWLCGCSDKVCHIPLEWKLILCVNNKARIVFSERRYFTHRPNMNPPSESVFINCAN